MATILLYGDTARYASMRHEVPLEIIDPFLVVVRGDRTHVMTNQLEASRIREVLPEAEMLTIDQLGLYDLVEQGVSRDEAFLQTIVRAVQTWAIDAATVHGELPVAVADRLREVGVALEIDNDAVEARRRVKTPAEMEGIHRAQRAAELGMAAGERMIREASPQDGMLVLDGEPLTAERVRAAIRHACSAAGAPAPPGIMVVSSLSGGGHDPGSGPLPADLPIEIDLWPCDEQSGCWADMTRTFVNGAISDEVAVLRDVVRDALESVRAAVRPGVNGRALYDIACDVVERAGHPTQRTREPGKALTHGFYFGLGHGVGLEVHEPPNLGFSGEHVLVAGDVIAIEPGIEGLQGIGGVRYEDLLLVTEEGCETLTNYPYEL